MSKGQNISTVTYQFPQDPEALGRTPGDQLAEAMKQVEFIDEALFDESVPKQKIDDLVAQLHHDIESFWRALARRYGQGYVDEIFQRHEDSLKKEDAA